MLKILGIQKHGKDEKRHDFLTEISAKTTIAQAVLRWLIQYQTQTGNDQQLLMEVKFHIQEQRKRMAQLKASIKNKNGGIPQDIKPELKHTLLLTTQILELERKELGRLWQEGKINHTVRNKLLHQLDHQSKNLAEESELINEI
jgi:hypothetical protein